MEIVWKNIKDIKPYPGNAKVHTLEQVTMVAKSLKEFGWKQPIVIDNDNYVIVGHCRVMGAKKNGDKKVPCVIAEDLTDEQIKAYRLADNKTNESEWIDNLLKTELEGITDIDMSEFGFEEEDPESLPELKKVELKPYTKVHYLITADINIHDKILKYIKKLEEIEGVEIESAHN